MADQLWTVTHATATGEWRSWTVTEEVAGRLIDDMPGAGLHPETNEPIQQEPWTFETTTGRALIWLTPGQSLTVERAR